MSAAVLFFPLPGPLQRTELGLDVVSDLTPYPLSKGEGHWNVNIVVVYFFLSPALSKGESDGA